MLLSTTCPACGETGPAPCASCWRQLRPAPSLPAPEGVRRCRALLVYEGTGRELLARMKYRNARAVLPWLGRGMADLLPPNGSDGVIDVVTWTPTTAARAAARGFDQAELLAHRVARHLGLPCRRLLRRAPGLAQTGRDATERRVGPVFHAPGGVNGLGVLLVDDVVTTGATLAAAARALRIGGAADVTAVAAARTPLKVSMPRTDP